MTAQLRTGAGNQTFATSNSGVGVTMTLAKPANTADRDYLIAVVMFRGDATPPAAPAGWSMAPLPLADTYVGMLCLYYKYIEKASREHETSYSWTSSGGGRKVVTLFRLVDGHPDLLIGETTPYATSWADPPSFRIEGLDASAQDCLLLTLISTNTPLQPNWTDEEGTPVVFGGKTTTGGTETFLQIGHRPLGEPGMIQNNDWASVPIPASGGAYCIALRTRGTPPNIITKDQINAVSEASVTLETTTLFGSPNGFSWEQTSGPVVQMLGPGTQMTFISPALKTASLLTFRVRAYQHIEKVAVYGPWHYIDVSVAPHNIWRKDRKGEWSPTRLGEEANLWEKTIDGQWSRPGYAYVPPGVDVPTLLAKPTFFVAHRGSGDEFPEHTMEAYTGVLSTGGDAIEVSVQTTSDGVLVCAHDETLDRITDSTGKVEDYTWQELYDNVRVTQQGILGEGYPDVRIPKLSDVLAMYAGVRVIFIEAKDGGAALPIFRILDSYAQQGMDLGKWFVYKQFFQGGTITKQMAHDRGMLVWGYTGFETTDAELDAEDYRVDIWGVPDFMSLERKAEIVARGKVVICWQVHRRAQVVEHQSIGLQGQMSSGLLYVYQNSQLQKTDSFRNRRKAHGDMWSSNIAVDNLALAYDTLGRGHHKFPDPICSTVMGSMCPTGQSYVIQATAEWNTPPAWGKSGIAFGCPLDHPLRPTVNSGIWNNPDGLVPFQNFSPGYYVTFSYDGVLTLQKYAGGLGWSPTTLDSAPMPDWDGTALDITITTTPSAITVVAGGATVSSIDTTYRGEYFHIAQGEMGELTYFRDLSVLTL